jgi:hypothetical protein
LRGSGERPRPETDPENDKTQAELGALDVSPQDWFVIVSSRPNVLVEGPEQSTELLIQALATAVRETMYDWNQPWPKDGRATVIVRAVDALSDEEQRQVLDLLNDSGNGFPPRQVVTTCTRPLFPLVHQGLCREDLYYRLNVVHLKIGEAPR